MTLILVGSIKKYTGLSGDTKPTLTVREAGSEFYETNTRKTYIWSGTAWGLK
jgi:hypothetical protein